MAIVVLMPPKWPFCLPSSQPEAIHLTKIRSGIRSMASSEAGGVSRKEDIFIVGAGIAGLATSVSLQWVGFGSVVLEQAESLTTGGTSITFFKNGWKVLDSIGVGSQLRGQYLEIQKIVIACDGTRSPVAKWMGFPDPNYVGHYAIRGIGFYPDGQPVEPKVNYVYGRGVRAGYLPISSTKVYWFLCFNSPSPGPKITDPSMLRQETNKLIQNWSSDLLDIIKSTPDDTFIRTPPVDHWLWSGISPPASTGNVVLVGDAWHPMTPNLGQGGCCALEDSMVLAKKLEQALKFRTISVEDAFKSYGRERWPQIFPLTVRANLVGALLQLDNPLVCSLRNNLILPKLVQLGPNAMT